MSVHYVKVENLEELVNITTGNFVGGKLHSNSKDWKEAISEDTDGKYRVTVSHIQELLTIRIADMKTNTCAPLAYVQYNVPRRKFSEELHDEAFIVPHMKRLLFTLGFIKDETS